MTAKPNIRRLFIPDPGYLLVDADLSGADAQVVAWEAEDEDLKRAFRAGVSIHDKNATDIFGDAYVNAPGDRKNKRTPKGKLYDENKRAVHATNYGGSARTMHLNPDIRWSMQKAEEFQTRWFTLHPGIREWHNRTERQLRLTRSVTNKFGYRIVFFDRVDTLLPEALAWGPQSTVALASFKGAVAVRKKFSFVQFLVQVHDSLVFQIPKREASALGDIQRALAVTIPYDDPLVIPSKVAVSDKSWGDCSEWKEGEVLPC